MVRKNTQNVNSNVYVITLHCSLGRRNKTYLPLVYVLTCGKDFFTYVEIFSKIKEWQPRLNPKSVMVDFELAAMKAVKQVFPEVNVYGCFFHLCQCIYRQIQANGLQSIYAEDENFAQYMRCLAALAFVPPEEVSKRYDELKELDFFKEKLNGTSAVDVGVQKLLTYFERTWIGRFARNKSVAPLYSINLWNVYSLTLAFFPRTNNAVEAWHNAINALFGGSHPCIYNFIEGIKKEQDATEISIAKMMSGIATDNKPGKKQFELGERLVAVVKMYGVDNAHVDIKDYLFGISSAISYPCVNN